MNNIKLILRINLFIAFLYLEAKCIEHWWGAWEENIVCGTITWKSESVKIGKYQTYPQYDMVIDFERGYGKQARSVGIVTFQNHQIGDRICFDLPTGRDHTLWGIISMIIIVFSGIVLFMSIIIVIGRFIIWVFS